MIIRELFTRLGFDVDSKPVDAYEQAISNLKWSLGGLVSAASAAAVGVFAMAKMTANAGSEILESSMKMGISTDTYQELSFAAKMAGTNMGTLRVAMRRVSTMMEDAKKPGSEAAKTFRKLGIDVKDLGSADKALEVFADKISAIENPMERSALSTKLMGRSGQELIPFMEGGSASIRKFRQDAIDLGYVMDKDVIAAADEFGDTFDTLTLVTDSLSKTIGGAFLPVMTEVMKKAIAWYKANNALIRSKLKKWIDEISESIRKAVKWAAEMFETIDGLIQSMGGWEIVLQRVAVALALLMVSKAVGDLAMMSVHIVRMTKELYLMARAFVAANLGPLLLGLTIVGLMLAIEDLVGYTEGKDSVIGRFLKSFEGAGGFLGGAREALRDLLDVMGLLQAEDREIWIKVRLDGKEDLEWYDKAILWLYELLFQDIPEGVAAAGRATATFVFNLEKDIDRLIAKIGAFWDGLPAPLKAALEDTASTIGGIFEHGLLGGLRGTNEPAPAPRVNRATGPLDLAPAYGMLGATVSSGLSTTAAVSTGPGNLALQTGGVVVNVTNTGATASEIAAKVKDAQDQSIDELMRIAMRNVYAGEE